MWTTDITKWLHAQAFHNAGWTRQVINIPNALSMGRLLNGPVVVQMILQHQCHDHAGRSRHQQLGGRLCSKAVGAKLGAGVLSTDWIAPGSKQSGVERST